ncbi:hypothetical protein SBADM41S_02071 [Streptomyces badius]
MGHVRQASSPVSRGVPAARGLGAGGCRADQAREPGLIGTTPPSGAAARSPYHRAASRTARGYAPRTRSRPPGRVGSAPRPATHKGVRGREPPPPYAGCRRPAMKFPPPLSPLTRLAGPADLTRLVSLPRLPRLPAPRLSCRAARRHRAGAVRPRRASGRLPLRAHPRAGRGRAHRGRAAPGPRPGASPGLPNRTRRGRARRDHRSAGHGRHRANHRAALRAARRPAARLHRQPLRVRRPAPHAGPARPPTGIARTTRR